MNVIFFKANYFYKPEFVYFLSKICIFTEVISSFGEINAKEEISNKNLY